MSTSDTRQAESPSYPTYESLGETNQLVRLSPDGKRLFWELNGPLTTAVSIMKNDWSPDSLEPYFQQTTGADITWHAVSQSPLTEPRVSSIVVYVDELERWEDGWLELHRNHGDGRYGELPDYDPNEDEEGPHLLLCCGKRRPRNKMLNIVVKPTASGKGFLTVHDFLSTVHPWLMSLREDIKGAIDVWESGPSASDMELMVNSDEPAFLMISEKSEWITLRNKPPNPLIANWSGGSVWNQLPNSNVPNLGTLPNLGLPPNLGDRGM